MANSTSAAAVNALQAQLDRHLAAIDGMDQKAALLPPAIGAVGVLGLLPGHVAGVAVLLEVLGLAAGLVAIAACFWSLSVRTVPVGARADQIASGVGLPFETFNAALARALAAASAEAVDTEKSKAWSLNAAFLATGVAIFLWVLAHATGS